MTILDLKLKKETDNYKFFWLQYTSWYAPDKIKQRSGFVIKSTGDCHWSDTGKRLNAHTERAVLSWIEEINIEGQYYFPVLSSPDRELNDKFNSILDQITLTKK